MMMERSRRVRLRIGRRLLPLGLAAVGLIFIVGWQRDAIRKKQARQHVQQYLEPLQKYVDQHGTLPLIYPRFPDQQVAAGARRFTYVSQAVARWARAADRPVLVGYGPSTRLFFRTSGRAVILYHNGQLREDWILSGQLRPLIAEQDRLAADME